MKEHQYRIKMKVPLGVRTGMMIFQGSFGQVTGVLKILGHEEPFVGVIEENGDCTLSGNLVSLMQTISYQAYGKISGDNIQLTLLGETSCFHITGKEILNEETV